MADLAGLLTGFSGLHGVLVHHEHDTQWLFAAMGPNGNPTSAPGPEAAASQADPPKKKRGRPRKNPSQDGIVRPARHKAPVQALEQELSQKLAHLQLLERENELLTQRYRLLEKVVEARSDHMRKLQQAEAGDADAALSLFGMTAQSMVQQSFKDMANKLRELMAQVGGCLMQSTVSGNSQPVVALITQVREVSKFMFLLRPDVVLVAGRNVNELCTTNENDVPVAPESHWQGVVLQLHLHVEQARLAWLLHDMYTRWLAALLAERSRLSDMLAQVLEVNRYGKIFTHATAGRYTDSMLVDKINQNLISERCLIVLVADVFHCTILNHTQTAECMLHSYPYAPDDIALLAAAAALHAPPRPAPALPIPASASLQQQQSQSGGSGAAASGGSGANPGSQAPAPQRPTLSAADLTRSVATAQGITLNTDALPLLRPTNSGGAAAASLPSSYSYSAPLLGAPTTTAAAQQQQQAACEVAHIQRPTITTCMELPGRPPAPPAATSPTNAAARSLPRTLSSSTMHSGQPQQGLGQQLSGGVAGGPGTGRPASSASTSSTSSRDAPTSLAPAAHPWGPAATSTSGTLQQQHAPAAAAAAAAGSGLPATGSGGLAMGTRAALITTSASGNTEVQPVGSPGAHATPPTTAGLEATNSRRPPTRMDSGLQPTASGVGVPGAAAAAGAPLPPRRLDSGLSGSGNSSRHAPPARFDSGLHSSTSGSPPPGVLGSSLAVTVSVSGSGNGSGGLGPAASLHAGGMGHAGAPAQGLGPMASMGSGRMELRVTQDPSPRHQGPQGMRATPMSVDPPTLPPAPAASLHNTYLQQQSQRQNALLQPQQSQQQLLLQQQLEQQHVLLSQQRQQRQQLLSQQLLSQQLRQAAAATLPQEPPVACHLAPLRPASAVMPQAMVVGGEREDELFGGDMLPVQRDRSDGSDALWSLFDALRQDGEPLWPARA